MDAEERNRVREAAARQVEDVLALTALENPELLSPIRALSRNLRNRVDLAVVNNRYSLHRVLDRVPSEEEMLARLQALPRDFDFGGSHQAALRLCIQRGYRRCVDFLLQQPSVNVAGNGFQALGTALLGRDEVILQQVLDRIPEARRQEVVEVIEDFGFDIHPVLFDTLSPYVDTQKLFRQQELVEAARMALLILIVGLLFTMMKSMNVI